MTMHVLAIAKGAICHFCLLILVHGYQWLTDWRAKDIFVYLRNFISLEINGLNWQMINEGFVLCCNQWWLRFRIMHRRRECIDDSLRLLQNVLHSSGEYESINKIIDWDVEEMELEGEREREKEGKKECTILILRDVKSSSESKIIAIKINSSFFSKE